MLGRNSFIYLIDKRFFEFSVFQKETVLPIEMMITTKGSVFLIFILLPNVLGFSPSLIRVPHVPQSIAKSKSKKKIPLSPSVRNSVTIKASVNEEIEEEIPPGDASIVQLVFNLVKNIVGAGVLSLPAGIAAFANAPSAVLPATFMIAGIGGLSAYGFALIGRCCAYTNTRSYRDAWSATVGKSTSWLPAVAVTFMTICHILAYSMILGDTFVSLLATMGIVATKAHVTIALTATALLPLCLLKNLSAFAPFSLIGSLGMIYTAIAMIIRYVGKAYTSSGKFGLDCAPSLRPTFGNVGADGLMTPSAAILVGMLSTAYGVRDRNVSQLRRL